MMRSLTTVIAVTFLLSTNAWSQCDTTCTGQGNATILMRGTCDLGSSVKFRYGGRPNARYKMLMDVGGGPTFIDGVGTFCLDFGPNFTKIDGGRLSARGFGSVRTDIPDAPELLGQPLAFQLAVVDPDAPNGIAISNGILMELCSPGTEGRACTPCDLEGCTPGYWKNHPQSWDKTGFAPEDLVSSVFVKPECLVECEPRFDTMTLIEALDLSGGPGVCGGTRILLRAAVASLLNASNPGVTFPRTLSQVIMAADDALATCDRNTILSLATEFDDDNNLGCPLNGGNGNSGDGQRGEDRECESGIVGIGFAHAVLYDGDLPTTIRTRVYDANDPGSVVGDVSFDYDPSAPPVFPIENGAICVTKVAVHTGAVVVHAYIDGSNMPGNKLPSPSVFETSVGNVVVPREIDTSCETPIGVGMKFNPVFIESILIVD